MRRQFLTAWSGIPAGGALAPEGFALIARQPDRIPGVIETVFGEWVCEAEQKLSASGDYPLIDDPEINMSGEIRTVAISVVEEYPGEVSTSIPSDIEPTIEFLERRLIASEGALPVRFVILNFLYRLAHFAGFTSKSSGRELHTVVWPHLETFVRLQEVNALNDARTIRWDITNACAIRDWSRASVLLDLLNSVGAITPSESRALKGQMYLCSVVAPRSERELSEDEDEDSAPPDFLCWWVPKLDRSYDFRSNVRPLGLLRWGVTLTNEGDYSAWECERLSDAAHEWEIGFQGTSDLLGAYRAGWAKCYFLLHDYLRATRQFDQLLAGGCGLPDELEPRVDLYRIAAECYRRANDSQTAIRLLERCAHEFPRAKGLWLELAKLRVFSPLDADFQEIQECLRREEEIDPGFSENPLASIALVLGEMNTSGFRTTLRRMAESNPGDLAFMNFVASRHWPTFRSFREDSRKEWVGATLFLWGSTTHSPLAASLRRRTVGIFADIAEGQLRQLFDQFRREKGTVVRQAMSPESTKDKFLRFLEGAHLGLGDMIFEIDATRRLPEPAHPELKSWLQRRAPRLVQNWDKSKAWRLNDLRRSSSHPGAEISEQEAVELYDLSVWLVNQLPTG